MPEIAPEPVYLTARQVADLVRVAEKTVLRWSLQDASMPVLRRGRVVRFPRERLHAWLDRQEPRSARRITRGSHNDVSERDCRTPKEDP
jgi:excisionase family DNA binding protein